jgi:hypothetical protein
MLKYFELQADSLQREWARNFLLRSDSVAGLYERCFDGRIVTDSARKLIVLLRSAKTSDHLKELGVVLTAEIVRDYAAFFELPERQMQSFSLECLHSGCLEAASHFGWAADCFENARSAVLQANFVNQWVHRHKAIQRTMGWRAELHCTHDLVEFRADLVVFNGREELCRIAALRTEPDRMIFSWELGKLRWSSETCVELQGVRGIRSKYWELEAYLSAL